MIIIVLGRCKRIEGATAIFSFRGHWQDVVIKQINVSSTYQWQRAQDYVLQLEVENVEGEVLWTRLLKARLLA